MRLLYSLKIFFYQSLPDQLNSGNYSTGKYYTEDEVNNIMQKETPHLSILHHNIRSMNQYFSQLMGLLLNIDIDFDIIALSEIVCYIDFNIYYI